MCWGKHIVGPHLGLKSTWGPVLYTDTLTPNPNPNPNPHPNPNPNPKPNPNPNPSPNPNPNPNPNQVLYTNTLSAPLMLGVAIATGEL